jgi:hypothetical protein
VKETKSGELSEAMHIIPTSHSHFAFFSSRYLFPGPSTFRLLLCLSPGIGVSSRVKFTLAFALLLTSDRSMKGVSDEVHSASLVPRAGPFEALPTSVVFDPTAAKGLAGQARRAAGCRG